MSRWIEEDWGTESQLPAAAALARKIQSFVAVRSIPIPKIAVNVSQQNGQFIGSNRQVVNHSKRSLSDLAQNGVRRSPPASPRGVGVDSDDESIYKVDNAEAKVRQLTAATYRPQEESQSRRQLLPTRTSTIAATVSGLDRVMAGLSYIPKGVTMQAGCALDQHRVDAAVAASPMSARHSPGTSRPASRSPRRSPVLVRYQSSRDEVARLKSALELQTQLALASRARADAASSALALERSRASLLLTGSAASHQQTLPAVNDASNEVRPSSEEGNGVGYPGRRANRDQAAAYTQARRSQAAPPPAETSSSAVSSGRSDREQRGKQAKSSTRAQFLQDFSSRLVETPSVQFAPTSAAVGGTPARTIRASDPTTSRSYVPRPPRQPQNEVAHSSLTSVPPGRFSLSRGMLPAMVGTGDARDRRRVTDAGLESSAVLRSPGLGTSVASVLGTQRLGQAGLNQSVKWSASQWQPEHTQVERGNASVPDNQELISFAAGASARIKQLEQDLAAARMEAERERQLRALQEGIERREQRDESRFTVRGRQAEGGRLGRIPAECDIRSPPGPSSAGKGNIAGQDGEQREAQSRKPVDSHGKRAAVAGKHSSQGMSDKEPQKSSQEPSMTSSPQIDVAGQRERSGTASHRPKNRLARSALSGWYTKAFGSSADQVMGNASVASEAVANEPPSDCPEGTMPDSGSGTLPETSPPRGKDRETEQKLLLADTLLSILGTKALEHAQPAYQSPPKQAPPTASGYEVVRGANEPMQAQDASEPGRADYRSSSVEMNSARESSHHQHPEIQVHREHALPVVGASAHSLLPQHAAARPQQDAATTEHRSSASAVGPRRQTDENHVPYVPGHQYVPEQQHAPEQQHRQQRDPARSGSGSDSLRAALGVRYDPREPPLSSIDRKYPALRDARHVQTSYLNQPSQSGGGVLGMAREAVALRQQIAQAKRQHAEETLRRISELGNTRVSSHGDDHEQDNYHVGVDGLPVPQMPESLPVSPVSVPPAGEARDPAIWQPHRLQEPAASTMGVPAALAPSSGDIQTLIDHTSVANSEDDQGLLESPALDHPPGAQLEQLIGSGGCSRQYRPIAAGNLVGTKQSNGNIRKSSARSTFDVRVSHLASIPPSGSPSQAPGSHLASIPPSGSPSQAPGSHLASIPPSGGPSQAPGSHLASIPPSGSPSQAPSDPKIGGGRFMQGKGEQSSSLQADPLAVGGVGRGEVEDRARRPAEAAAEGPSQAGQETTRMRMEGSPGPVGTGKLHASYRAPDVAESAAAIVGLSRGPGGAALRGSSVVSRVGAIGPGRVASSWSAGRGAQTVQTSATPRMQTAGLEDGRSRGSVVVLQPAHRMPPRTGGSPAR